MAISSNDELRIEKIKTREQARESVLRNLAEYVEGRKSDVARGAESPHLAALLLQKYGYGLCDAFDEVFGRTIAGPTYGDVDRVVTEIDPQWQENAKRRWAGRPTNLASATLYVPPPSDNPSNCYTPT